DPGPGRQADRSLHRQARQSAGLSGRGRGEALLARPISPARQPGLRRRPRPELSRPCWPGEAAKDRVLFLANRLSFESQRFGERSTMVDAVQSRAGSGELRIANELSEIERVAEWVDDFGAKCRLSSEVIIALNVSLDEIINNIISYGYDDSGHHDIMVRLAFRDGRVEVVVEDDGKPFNPLLLAAPDLTAKERKVGGVGVHFVRNLMDDLEYARDGGINQLRLIKKVVGMTTDKLGLKLVETLSDGVTIIEAHGRLDSASAKEFGEALLALVRAGRRAIVVDLHNIAY